MWNSGAIFDCSVLFLLMIATASSSMQSFLLQQIARFGGLRIIVLTVLQAFQVGLNLTYFITAENTARVNQLA